MRDKMPEMQKRRMSGMTPPPGMAPPGMDISAMRKAQRKAVLKNWAWVGLALIAVFVLLIIFPDKKQAVTDNSLSFFREMILVLPAVMIMIGLITVWVPREMILKYMGKASGVKGIFLSIALGSLPTGPLYLAFPLAATLLQKGASISNVVLFLSAWACIKIPQELMEIQFLGVSFASTRLVLTVIFVVFMAKLIERMMEVGKR